MPGGHGLEALSMLTAAAWFVADSALEGDGFEPSVPLHILTVYKDAARSSRSPTPISELAARLCPSESLLHARRRTRRHKRSAFRALHRAHPRRRAGVRIPFPPPAKGGPGSQTLPFPRNTYFLRYCFYGIWRR